MTRSALLGLAALLAAAAAPAQQPPGADLKAAPPGARAGETRCAACHTTEGWGDVKFVHERTGFPLTGRHAQVACKRCHPVAFDQPVGRSCNACHRDPHGGYSGMRCGSCHDTDGWKSRFGADSHRRTNFPLQGKHALIPCEECHGDQRDRSFARPTVLCADCHQADLARAAGSGIPHDGFPSNCLGCHTFWRWRPASFSGHDRCFPISSGRHAGIRCNQCHVTIPASLTIGSCNSQPWPDCQRCHSCASVAGNHGGVSNFNAQCPVPPSCYRCHPSGTAEGGLRLLR
jgi:hypothetical protein